MSNDANTIIRMRKLDKLSDFIQWKRCLYANIKHNDPRLVDFSPKPTVKGSTREEINRLEANSVKSKSNILLCLKNIILAKTQTTVDDDTQQTKALWNKLDQLFTMYSAPVINKLQKPTEPYKVWRLENYFWPASLHIHENKRWAFFICLERLKKKKIPAWSDRYRFFDFLAMVSTFSEMDFHKVLAAVKAKTERR